VRDAGAGDTNAAVGTAYDTGKASASHDINERFKDWEDDIQS